MTKLGVMFLACFVLMGITWFVLDKEAGPGIQTGFINLETKIQAATQ